MVDTLVSGASASRRVGSTPISGTNKKADDRQSSAFLFKCCSRDYQAQLKTMSRGMPASLTFLMSASSSGVIAAFFAEYS